MGFQVGFWGHTVMVGLRLGWKGTKVALNELGTKVMGFRVGFWGMGFLEWGWGSMGGQGWVKKAEMWA